MVLEMKWFMLLSAFKEKNTEAKFTKYSLGRPLADTLSKLGRPNSNLS